MAQFDNIPGYRLLKEEELADVKGTGLYFKHIKSGARVCVIKNDDENKVFYIGFRTPPTDSTGVAHIVEHTTLCGSTKFPVKDPFIELAKGSLNTFLNAFTYPDKTVYPVASCNDKDFANLMDVYLDAVFHPNFYKEEKIFRQEGWRYELNDEKEDIKLNGIVYSEMKGAYSSADDLFYRYCQGSIFPDNQYGVDSGGDPEHIPDLTYEQYLDFHKRFYHPVNSYIYLYGDLDVRERLTWLDENYLSKYDVIDIDSSVKIQKEFGGIREVTEEYSVDNPDENGKGVFYSLNVFAGETDDLIKGISFEVLDYVLFEAPGAPVREALTEAGIGDDIISFYSGDIQQPSFTIGVKNAKPGMKDDFKRVVFDTLKKCVKDGIKESSLKAAINRQEFRYREADFGRLPKGLMYGITCLSTWLYNDDMPFVTLHMNEAYKEVRAKIGTGWFESLVDRYFLNTGHGALLTFLPKVGLNAELEKKTAERLKAMKAGMSRAEIQKLIDDTAALKKYQSEPSTPEQLRTIPLLSVSDIRKEIKECRYEEVFKDAGKIVWENYDANGVAYIKAFFDVSGVDTKDVPYLGLMSILTLVDTAKHTYGELNDDIYIHTGGVGMDVSTFKKYGDISSFLPCISIATKTMADEAVTAVGYLDEIIRTSKFDDVKRLRDLLFMMRSDIESSYTENGTSVARARVASYFSESASFMEAISGIDFYGFLKDITDHFDERIENVIAKLKELSAKIFTRDNLFISITCGEKELKAFERPLRDFIEALPFGKSEKHMKFVPERRNEGFKTPGQVQYNVRAGNIYLAGEKYSGVFDILRSMLSYGFLWNEIRVKGGAYGAGFSCNNVTGFTCFTSYRDPNLKNTYENFEKTIGYLETFEADDREMTKAILGTFGDIDAPLSPRQEGERSFGIYMSGVTDSERQRFRDEALNCRPDDIRKTAAVLKKVLDQNYFCTVGSAKALDEEKDLFMSTRTLV